MLPVPDTALAKSLSPTCASWTLVAGLSIEAGSSAIEGPTNWASISWGAASGKENRWSTLVFKDRARRRATSVDGQALPDSNADYAWRLIAAKSASACWESPASSRFRLSWLSKAAI